MSNPQNGLIALLPARDRKRLLAQCEPTQLVLAQVVCEAGGLLSHVHFPVDAFISLLAVEGEHSRLEVGMVGHEGMLGVHHFLGVAQAPLHALVQGAGTSLRMAAGDFQAEVQASAALQTVMSRYVHVCMQQLATSALCLRFHEVGPRMARWLLMTQDRSRSDRFHVTQDFLSTMLGVRRVGVTAAALLLQERGLIAYHRGEMQVRDRPGLQAAACSCYARDQQTYQALLAPH